MSFRALDSIPDGLAGKRMACDFFFLLPYSCCGCSVSRWQVLCLWFYHTASYKHITRFYCCQCCSSLSLQATLLTLAVLCQPTLAKTTNKTKFQSVSFIRAMLDVPLSNRTGEASLKSVYKASLKSAGIKSVSRACPATGTRDPHCQSRRYHQQRHDPNS